MNVFNIRRDYLVPGMKASGLANRWNRDDEFVLYTAGSISLATLELVAHRSGIRVDVPYCLVTLEIRLDKLDVTEWLPNELPTDWQSVQLYPKLQEIGSNWYQNQQSLALKVPSALVPQESNFIINTKHPAFNKKVKVAQVDPFFWDQRLL
ncbi:MAG: hypothetical protein CFE24_04485 [Flavobacterium sp. BFFFF2]|nr:MAG: hypothetical protein CFE24_04485 [Flavobacterium sp. BFFFF2]